MYSAVVLSIVTFRWSLKCRCHSNLIYRKYIFDISLHIPEVGLYTTSIQLPIHLSCSISWLQSIKCLAIGEVTSCLWIADLCSLIHALISSRLDIGLPQSKQSRLQMVQNAAARYLIGTKKRDHITPVLASLHWLPIKLRVDFKIILFAYKALHNSAPDYICDLIKPYTASRSLRSSDQLLLSVPRSRCKTKGDRAFSVVAPKLWNSLPLNIRASPSLDAFKSSLKTYFYSLAFEWCCVCTLNSLIGVLWNYILIVFDTCFIFCCLPFLSLLNSVIFIVKHFGSTTVVLNLCSINKICLALPYSYS